MGAVAAGVFAAYSGAFRSVDADAAVVCAFAV